MPASRKKISSDRPVMIGGRTNGQEDDRLQTPRARPGWAWYQKAISVPRTSDRRPRRRRPAACCPAPRRCRDCSNSAAYQCRPKLSHCTSPRRSVEERKEHGQQQRAVEDHQRQRRDRAQAEPGVPGQDHRARPARPAEHGRRARGRPARPRRRITDRAAPNGQLKARPNWRIDDAAEGDAAHPADHLRRHEVADRQDEGERGADQRAAAATAARPRAGRSAQAVAPRSAEASIQVCAGSAPGRRRSAGW